MAWRRFERVPTGEQSLPWLLTVAHNHLRSHRRRVLRDRGLLERLPAPEHVRPTSDGSGIGWREIRSALDRLSSQDRELVLLVAWDGLSPAQAAGVLGLALEPPGPACIERARGWRSRSAPTIRGVRRRTRATP